MKIEIDKYIIATNEHGMFDLVELKKTQSKDGSKKIREVNLCYNVSLNTAVKRIIHSNLHCNPNIVSLRQYLVDFRNEVKKIEKLLELKAIKRKSPDYTGD